MKRPPIGKKEVPCIAAKRNPPALRVLLTGFLAVYLITVLWYTLGKRNVGYYPAYFRLFWSYALWFEGQWTYGRAILANIAMFVPFGFLVPAAAGFKTRKGFICVFLLAVAFSLLIETAQFLTLRGRFEFDDVCSNSLGALCGILLFLAVRCWVPEKLLRSLLLASGAGTLLICLGVFAFSKNSTVDSPSPLSQGLCFQAEDAFCLDGGVRLDGVCFWYGQGPTDYAVVLQSTQTGKRYPLKTESGLPRPDAAAYFGRDSVKGGFRAEGNGIEAGGEYEIMLDFGLFRCLPTGVYLTVEAGPERTAAIHYVPTSQFCPLETENTDLDKIVSSGVLRVYDPADHVYVYFYEGSLYWIAEEGFAFQQDRPTHIELLLWTTETEKLSEKSRAAGRGWDTLAVYFEQNEVTGNFGRYRLCAKELPADYPITSIRTGRYADGWIWQADFWPVFDFSKSP